MFSLLPKFFRIRMLRKSLTALHFFIIFIITLIMLLLTALGILAILRISGSVLLVLLVGDSGSTDHGWAMDFLVADHTLVSGSVNGGCWVAFLLELDELLGHGAGADLSELGGNWGWHISDQVLEHLGGDVVIHKSESSSVELLGLSGLHGDWCWLVSAGLWPPWALGHMGLGPGPIWALDPDWTRSYVGPKKIVSRN